VFVLGGALAALLASVVFYFITKQVILTPVQKLHELADHVADGDLSKRVELSTADEFERLGRRFNAMLDAITSQQNQLRQANRALDLRLGELAEANVSLYEANRIKNEFLANVSHELRTPLNSIIGFAELLAETDDAKRRRHATYILSSARMLLGIINDLLDLARIEAGRADVRSEKVSITDLCETLTQLVRPLADKSRLELEVRLDEDIPLIVTDPGKVRQILYNLLSNAIKFTPPGGKVTVSTRSVPAGESGLQCEAVAVSLSDSGPGIPAAEQQRIFEKFHRVDGRLTREHGGAGLGLAITRELTNLLGGRLALDSEPGHGATFTVTLPVAPAEPQAGPGDPRT
jgi:signal transduction histidine kinase